MATQLRHVPTDTTRLFPDRYAKWLAGREGSGWELDQPKPAKPTRSSSTTKPADAEQSPDADS